MTADEIRNLPLTGSIELETLEAMRTENTHTHSLFLREIAAQLAELNANNR